MLLRCYFSMCLLILIIRLYKLSPFHLRHPSRNTQWICVRSSGRLCRVLLCFHQQSSPRTCSKISQYYKGYHILFLVRFDIQDVCSRRLHIRYCVSVVGIYFYLGSQRGWYLGVGVGPYVSFGGLCWELSEFIEVNMALMLVEIEAVFEVGVVVEGGFGVRESVG